jgi:hypothetical protein
MSEISEHALDAPARRSSPRWIGARKSRWWSGTIDNLGGYRLIDPQHNICVEGERFNLSAEYVIKSCKQLERETKTNTSTVRWKSSTRKKAAIPIARISSPAGWRSDNSAAPSRYGRSLDGQGLEVTPDGKIVPKVRGSEPQ